MYWCVSGKLLDWVNFYWGFKNFDCGELCQLCLFGTTDVFLGKQKLKKTKKIFGHIGCRGPLWKKHSWRELFQIIILGGPIFWGNKNSKKKQFWVYWFLLGACGKKSLNIRWFSLSNIGRGGDVFSGKQKLKKKTYFFNIMYWCVMEKLHDLAGKFVNF